MKDSEICSGLRLRIAFETSMYEYVEYNLFRMLPSFNRRTRKTSVALEETTEKDTHARTRSGTHSINV